MSVRFVTITLTRAQASALLYFALEGEVASEDLVQDGQRPPNTHAAGVRAVGALARALNEHEGGAP